MGIILYNGWYKGIDRKSIFQEALIREVMVGESD